LVLDYRRVDAFRKLKQARMAEKENDLVRRREKHFA